MRLLVLLSVLSLFLTSCSKAPTDAQIRRQVVGTWQPTSSRSGTTVDEMRPDGSFSSKWTSDGKDHELTGTWDVQGGFLVATFTNDQGKTLVQREKIARISKSEMVCWLDGHTNVITVMTRQ